MVWESSDSVMEAHSFWHYPANLLVKHLQSLCFNLNLLFSCADLVLEAVLTHQFFSDTEYLKKVANHNDNVVQDEKSHFFGNASFTRKCHYLNKTEDTREGPLFLYSCIEKDIRFGIFSVMIIFVPSCNILSAVYGPSTAGLLSTTWGFIMGCVGFTLYEVTDTEIMGIAAWSLALVGLVLIFMGNVREREGDKAATRKQSFTRRFINKAIFFPFLLAVSPTIYLLIRLQWILRPENPLVKNQLYMSILPLDPALEFCLQLYIIFTRFDRTPTGIQTFTTIGLALVLWAHVFLNFMRLEKDSRRKGAMSRTLPIFVFNCLYRAVTLTLVIIFYRLFSVFWLFLYFGMCWRVIHFARIFYDLEPEENKGWAEAITLSPITISNLGPSRSERIYRQVSFYFHMFASLMILGCILYFCNTGQADVVKIPTEYIQLLEYKKPWSQIPIVEKVEYLNNIVGATIGVGILAWILDVVCSLYGPSLFHDFCPFSHSSGKQNTQNDLSSA